MLVLFIVFTEPTTGLDSKAAQVVIRCIRRVALSGRSVICTIHQPSTYIFNNFDSLLLLQRGGQAVYFGELGRECQRLIDYLSSVPGSTPFPGGQNPATWMLELLSHEKKAVSFYENGIIKQTTDFHAYFKNSSEYQTAMVKITALCPKSVGIVDHKHHTLEALDHIKHAMQSSTAFQYSSSPLQQYKELMNRTFVMYWRTPTYNFLRFIINLVIALLFGSVYANQKYTTTGDCIARVGIIFLSALFSGVVAMNTVIPVMMANRAAFYREQQERMYQPLFYEIALNTVEASNRLFYFK